MEELAGNQSQSRKRKREDSEHKRKVRRRRKSKAHAELEENGLPSGRPLEESSKTMKSKSGFGWAQAENGPARKRRTSRTAELQNFQHLKNGDTAQTSQHSEVSYRKKSKQKILTQDNSGTELLGAQMPMPDKDEDGKPSVNGSGFKYQRGKRGKRKGALNTNIRAVSRIEEDKHLAETAPLGVWCISKPTGGRFIHAQPLFSADEKHVILATESAALVYSTTTSLLVHSLFKDIEGTIANFALSPTNGQIVYLGTDSGQITCWNWVIAEHLGSWATNTEILDISITAFGGSTDIAYTLNKSRKYWTIVANHLGSNDGKSDPHSNLLLAYKRHILSFKVLEAGRFIVAIAENTLLVGYSREHVNAVLDLKYEWREFQCGEPLTCFDVYYSFKKASNSEKREKSKKNDGVECFDGRLDIAVGGSLGCVYVYQDILDQLKITKNPRQPIGAAQTLSPAQYHWHRQAVGSVSWSKDGNYLISGGRETVLVLWQLDTGKKQFLPHLEAPIEELTVSPTGSSYAVRLGDNSVMVLSTTELEPNANFAGIQCQTSTTSDPTSRFHKRDSAHIAFSDESLRITGAVNPRMLQQMLLAVPASQSDKNHLSGLKSNPYLQTFDISNSRHISKQALTRTNATNTNLGPDGTEILESNVSHLQISRDGKWLATADEWTPPVRDVESLTVDSDDIQAAVECQREVSLKFWSWDSSREQWRLNSRIMMPHPCDQPAKAGRVFDLKMNPSGSGFASIGEDCCVRTWRLHSSRHNDIAPSKLVEADEKETASNSEHRWWAQDRTVFVQKDSVTHHLDAKGTENAIIAYSNDGSTIVAHQSYAYGEPIGSGVDFIDADSGEFRETRSCLPKSAGSLKKMEFLERYLICVGERGLSVLDVTSFNLINYIELSPAPQMLFDYHLAVNIATRTFALSYPQISPTSRLAKTLIISNSSERHYDRLAAVEDLQGRLQIYSPSSTSPIFDTVLTRPATLLLSASGVESEIDRPDDPTSVEKRGYVLIDSGATVQTVKPRGYPLNRTENPINNGVEVSPSTALAEQSLRGVPGPDFTDDSDMDIDNAADTIEGEKQMPDTAVVPAERVVVRPEQLAELFDYPTLALPSLRSMFSSVVSLYSSK